MLEVYNEILECNPNLTKLDDKILIAFTEAKICSSAVKAKPVYLVA